MTQKCAIRGENFPNSEGMLWSELRPAVQEFLKTIRSDWQNDTFISYNALNDLLRAYISNLSAEEVKEHQALAKKVEERFLNEEILKPLVPLREEKKQTFGEQLSDKIADFGGSWVFILSFLAILIIWMLINAFFLNNKGFDPYPFILLNLVLSCLAALQAPIIMMSQNRQETKDRERNEYDFKVNLKAETEVRLLHEKMDHMLLHYHKNMVELLQLQLDMMQQMQQRMDVIQKFAASKLEDDAREKS